MTARPREHRGPFRASNMVSGDRHEISHGNAIYCAPTGGAGARGTGYGFELIDTDPAVESAGIDAGFAPAEHTLRAPDVAVGVPDQHGWIQGVPPLALEYAGTGQHEDSLQDKIADLLEAGTRWVWVVRLVGPRRVEIYEADREPITKTTGDELTAPGVLQNPIRAEALWDRTAAHEGTLRNLLQRAGYESVAAIRDEGREEGREEGRDEGREEGREEGRAQTIVDVLVARSLIPTAPERSRILAMRDPTVLSRWVQRSVQVASVDALFAED